MITHCNSYVSSLCCDVLIKVTGSIIHTNPRPLATPTWAFNMILRRHVRTRAMMFVCFYVCVNGIDKRSVCVVVQLS